MSAWHIAGLESRQITTLTTHELCARLDDGDSDPWILDVRSAEEIAGEGAIPDAHHILVTQLPDHVDAVPRDREVLIFCGSGLRSTLAASYLQRKGWDDVTVVLGGTKGWDSTSCPLDL